MAVLFAPILRTTQPAFAASNDNLVVYYTLPPAASLNGIDKFEVKVNQQETNTNVVNNNVGVLSIAASEDSFTILKSSLKEGHWAAGSLYKIQMRLVSGNEKSEWSNVMITKAITPPQVKILNADTTESADNEISAVYGETETMPTFYGSCGFQPGESEYLDKYRFDLVLDDEIVESSGEIQYNRSSEQAPQYRFKTQLPHYKTYTVHFSIVSNNGYEAEAMPYDFEVISTDVGKITNLEMTVDSTSPACIENAMVCIYLTTKQAITGNYAIVRSDEDTNYQVWEDIAYLSYAQQELTNELVYRDYTIECGKQYKYGIQRHQTNDARSEVLLPSDQSPHSANFEYSYLCGNGTQIKLNFNPSVSSFKHTQLLSKQDTLGSKYPTISLNGHAYYAEFPISALISGFMDEANLFMVKDFGIEYRGDNEIGRDEILTTQQNPSSVKIEREFRHRVETFLNDGKYKLFKTPTEADKNIIVALTGASLTPQQSLNRMIYSFSTTAYEVAENTLANLKDLGIAVTGDWTDLSTLDETKSFGQITGTWNPGEEIFDQIRAMEETEIDGYKYKVTSLRWLKLNSDDETMVTFLLNGKEVNVAAGKQYNIADLEDANITSIQVKSKAKIQLDYGVNKKLIELYEPIIRTQYIDRDWGQINHTPSTPAQENLDVRQMIIDAAMVQAANTYNEGNALIKEDDGTYSTTDGSMTFALDGIETINFQNAEGAIIEIDGKTVYIGSTSQYRLQPIVDKIESIVLVNDMPLLINYKVRLTRKIVQGG